MQVGLAIVNIIKNWSISNTPLFESSSLNLVNVLLLDTSNYFISGKYF